MSNAKTNFSKSTRRARSRKMLKGKGQTVGSGVPAGSSINKIQVDQPNNGETKTRLE
eukprot:CAMPEP_0119106120 /NCGR_PEP_ID=MMETSP1180-20130426/3906_1 /TAXON_ID=3052 ORGANISM="Chlamydomonas cf sp, Strain CCMP681" /NCGR_SAMPLE_ID=MMETSP1180 /ASSEMBLY_ACC=CAM_ASM_000741 /LENGTH=56 /DNA_ID=CAMNT_0007091369 /DNA_START=73 /DNA_END=243 /DNA_ORIENTATION=-